MISLELARRRTSFRRQASALRLLAVFLVAILASCRPGPPTRSQSYTYKTVGDLQIRADVHRLDDDVARPVVVWVHGGALIFGGRGELNDVTRVMLEAGYILVSIDYRLAPETKLPAIIEDLEDALAWVRSRGSELFNARTDRIAVMGPSAGGYLTLMSGFRVEPPPTVLVSLWGYGDLVGDWYSQPSEHRRHGWRKISAEKARTQVEGPPISRARDRDGNGRTFYNYTRQNGLWPIEVSGWDPRAERERFYPFMPVMNVTGDYPPTMLVHGTDDTDVPYQQSLLMAEEFEEHGVAHELVTIPGGEHGQLVGGAYDQILAWVDRYMR